jgi:gamma-glutamylaminecyclotransferase
VRLFVYGSLRRGAENNHMLGDSAWLGPARTTATCTLKRVSWFPGLLPDGATTVVGDLYDVDEATLATLDEYEGPWFRRSTVTLQDGSDATCWLVDPAIAAGRPIIESGDFLAGEPT